MSRALNSRANARALRVSSLLLGSMAVLAVAADFETPATLQASKILPASLVKGPHFSVSEAVKVDGHYQQFEITSDFGNLNADGRTMLKIRVVEVDALARLQDVSKSEVFAQAAGGAVLNVGKGVAAVAKDPGATAKGLGTGMKRFGTNLGRKGKSAAQSVTAEKPDSAKSSETSSQAATNAAMSVVGVNGAARKWAQKLGVDPYTTNKPLHDALVSIGKIDAAGGIAAKVVVPIPPVASTTATVGGLVWGKDPQEVQKVNETRLAELGVPKDVAARFLKTPTFTLTNLTRFITALHSVKAKGCADYVAAAAEAEDEGNALFFTESAELLAGLHKTQPVSAILEDSRALIAKTSSGAAVALLPFDYLQWTEPLSKAAVEIAGRAKKEIGATALEVQFPGTATAPAKAGLLAAGWKVKEGVRAGLLSPAAN
jgi:hypothetical protein